MPHFISPYFKASSITILVPCVITYAVKKSSGLNHNSVLHVTNTIRRLCYRQCNLQTLWISADNGHDANISVETLLSHENKIAIKGSRIL